MLLLREIKQNIRIQILPEITIIVIITIKDIQRSKKKKINESGSTSVRKLFTMTSTDTTPNIHSLLPLDTNLDELTDITKTTSPSTNNNQDRLITHNANNILITDEDNNAPDTKNKEFDS